MLVVSLLEKYKKYLKRSCWILGFLQAAEIFALLFLLVILFDGYKLTNYFPELKTYIRTQGYIDPYQFNIHLMAVEALILTPAACKGFQMLTKKGRVDLISRLERTFPELRTRLSTAYDNSQNLNIVTKKLLEDVNRQLTVIRIKKISPRKEMFRSFIMLLLTCGAIIFCIHQGFSFDVSPGELMDDIMGNIPDIPETTFDEDSEREVSPETAFKAEALIIKNGEQVEMEINPSLGLGFTSRTDADTEYEFGENSEKFNETFRYSQTYTENLPEEYEPMIKQYFEDLSS